MSENTKVTELKTEMHEALETVVAAFNKGFAAWQKEYGSDANFHWAYSPKKYLLLETVTMTAFSKPGNLEEKVREAEKILAGQGPFEIKH